MKVISILMLLSFHGYGQTKLSERHQKLIAHGKEISLKLGESFHKDFDFPPFSILLISKEYECLIDHYYQTDDFARSYYDTIIHSTVHYRDRKIKNTSPRTINFEGLFTIVIRTPEYEKMSDSEWLLQLTHQRFHQFQYSSPKYTMQMANDRIDENAIDLFSSLTRSANNQVFSLFDQYKSILAKISQQTSFDENTFEDFLRTKDLFYSSLENRSLELFLFLLYHEGAAKFAELTALKLLDKSYDRLRIVSQIESLNLLSLSNDDFGILGYTELSLIEQVNPKWKDFYLDSKFTLEELYPNPIFDK